MQADGGGLFARCGRHRRNRVSRLIKPQRAEPGEGRGGAGAGIASPCRAAGAKVLARLLGAGMSCDAHHMTAPQPEGIRAARRWRQRSATPKSVAKRSATSMHGTGTPHNDAAESRAVRDLWEIARPVPMSSIKSMCGHTLGAAGSHRSGSFGAIAMHGVPPTKTCASLETEFGLDYIPEVPRQKQVDVVLSSSFAFWRQQRSAAFRSGLGAGEWQPGKSATLAVVKESVTSLGEIYREPDSPLVVLAQFDACAR